MSPMPKRKEEKKPLDMTTEEAMHFLFPKKVVSELKRVANPEPAELAETKDSVVDSLPRKE